MYFVSQFVDPMKTAMGGGISSRHMVTVVGKLFTRSQLWGLAHDPIALNHESRAIGMLDDPLPTQQGDGAVGAIADGNKINEGMRLVGRETRAAVMVAEFIEGRLEARQFAGAGHSRQPIQKSRI